MRDQRLAAKLESVANGEERLTEEEALEAFASLPLATLFKYADQARERLNGNICTFVIDRNINYTNICEVRCKFCAFSRDEDDKDAFVLSIEEIVEKVREAVGLGATQVMLQGGLCSKTGLGYITGLFKELKRSFPRVVIHSLTAPEVEFLARLEGKSIEEVLKLLRKAGLDSLPGGGAEILVDEIRWIVSPKKTTAQKWLEVHETAHKLNIPTTATMVIGHQEKPEHRILHLSLIRNLQDKTDGFRAFIPWIYYPGKTELGGKKTTSPDYLKTVAIARLFLDNIKHLQTSWLTIGKPVAQLTLRAGVDDMGSLMLEENVIRSTGYDFMSMKIEEMVHLIRSSGLKPAQRATDYSILKTF